ncbi:hypothetical protein GCM10027423_52020 [Spirosoma arcticum]
MAVVVPNVTRKHFYNGINRLTGMSAMKRPKIAKFGYRYVSSVKWVLVLDRVHGKQRTTVIYMTIVQ